ncbi:metal dependent phosphohydrolase [Liquorilactobacillus sucicola DSM 21376 = JCM 15457]|uniref:HD superfamily hydrolase n=1 Tax=Liquorilactobacillus sucicola DSM 21376 = JCM 15457 TaxID=1423806 RepID=A0A023CYP3_9LACO|nr:HD domain-containing protein [Liquorilactobacillus sucicola]KRN07688.1 HD superfamily hydrolase [Liquorilactobacillus sucicola DSM 21376 = JCM 15457]GAJ26676.1 metal dependent phosphohydrolase [Liquorilactobacillus sucicola DSM 21376 = JCM 15457]
MRLDTQLKNIRSFSYKKMHLDKTGHGFDHIQRVVNMSEQLLKYENADNLVTLSAAYLHDVADDKLSDDPAALEEEMRTFLQKNSLTTAQITKIILITQNLSFSKSLESDRLELSLEGKIVQDADRLDAIGAIGITRAIYYGGAHAEKIYDPAILPRQTMTKKEYRDLSQETIINHFYEKLLKIKDMLNTETAKRIAESRQQVMLSFLDSFKREWNAEK